MVYKSFGIIRTNVGLTTNIKLMVKSDYKLYLDSIDSNDDLSLSRFKKFAINKKDRYDRLIPNFFNKFPSDLAFDIKYDNDVDSMKDDFKHQYDEIYQYGARNIINNRSYSEEFEYFAPLYIFPDNLPNSFIIFRVDDPGLDIYNKDNFSELIVKNLKTVKRFDLTKKSPLGEWLDINYTRNDSFPITPLDVDFKRNEFSKWYGIDYKTGGYVNKSIFLEEWFGEEKEIFEMEKFIFDGYKDKKVVFPNILNLSFLFDDTPSTADRKRKWSLNRYYGFYFDDMEHVISVFPTKTKETKENISITKDNIITHPDGYPFIEEWNDNITNYIEIEGIFYRIERLENIKEPELPSEIVDDLEDDVVIIDFKNNTETTSINSAFVEEFLDYIVYTYKIISTKTLSKFTNSYINKNTSISINSDNEIKISDVDYDVDLFDNADVWLIEINGVFHNIIRSSTGSLKLVTDYSFLFDDKSTNYSYKVGGDETIVSMLKKQGDDQEEFKIYKLRFTDLKDFDTRIIDTEPSKFEYELNDKLTDTDESKMYVTDLNSETNPKEVDSFVIDEKLVNIPVSSEYTANYETFKITETGLTELWRKNSVYCRWGFQKSLSGNDYPYVLNNSLLFEDFNRTSNPFNPEPKRIERNLDYFYTINSDSSDYVHHTLHLEEYNGDNSLKSDYFFDLRKYLNEDGYDYYSNFFNKRSNFFNGKISRNTIKHSYFNKGDQSIPNVTLFRGIKFLIYDVEDIRKNENNELDVINLKTSNEFQDYKFSILLSDNKENLTKTYEEDFHIKECEIAATHSLPFTNPTTPSYDDSSSERKIYHDGSKRDDLVGKYIIFGDDMNGSTIPDFTTNQLITEHCEHVVLFKIKSCDEDPNTGYFYLVLGKPNGDPIDISSTTTNQLPTSLGNFKTIDSIDDYPYIILDGISSSSSSSEVTLGGEIKLDINGSKYDVIVTEKDKLDNGDTYIIAYDTSNSGINLPPGAELIFDINNITTSSLLTNGKLTYVDIVSENMMKWITIENWQMDKEYPFNSYVSYDDIIYRSVSKVGPSNPTVEVSVDSNKYTIKSAPYNIDGWVKFDYDKDKSYFYNFSDIYAINDIVYSNGDYYKCVFTTNIPGGYDFWNPYYNINGKGYSKNEVVLHKSKYYESIINKNFYSPSENYPGSWLEITPGVGDTIKWDKILIWNPSKSYILGDVILHNEVVYKANKIDIEIGDEPGMSDNWTRENSLLPDSDIIYKPNKNPFIRFNNNYYLSTSNRTNSTLDNGIKIYINKKWKNVLVNIEIKDNTTPNLKNINRDELYVELNKKLTANNFINCINDFSNKYDFIDYLKYIIIDEEGDITEYDYNDIEGLPYLINCEFPDELEVKIDSLNTENIDLKNDLIAKKVLKDGFLDNNEQINYYNDVPVAVKITENKNEPKTFSNFGGNKNLTNNLLYRFSGFYMPIFYDVHMFYKGLEKGKDIYKFATTCTTPVSFDNIETPNLPWMNPIPEGDLSYRTWFFEDKFKEIGGDPIVMYNKIMTHNLNPFGVDRIIYHSPIKQGWDAVLVNYERNASYYHYFLPDDKKYVISDEPTPNTWGTVPPLAPHNVFSTNWFDDEFIDNKSSFTTKIVNLIQRDKYVYKTPYDITPYIGWYVVASDYVIDIRDADLHTNAPNTYIEPYYDHLVESIYTCENINSAIVVMYKIETARFNDDTGFFEFSVVYPDGGEPLHIINHIEKLMLVENLNDNFGVYIESDVLEVSVGDVVKIIDTDSDLSNNIEPYYIKHVTRLNKGFLLDIYDANDNRLSFHDKSIGSIELPKSSYIDNYKFNTDLTEFGNMLEKKVSKINRKGSVLKLKDKSDIRSIYPMLDEFGYTFTDFFVFKGTFDFNYHLETYGSEGESEGLLDVNDLVKSFNLGKK